MTNILDLRPRLSGDVLVRHYQCVLVEDGGITEGELAHALAAIGWRVERSPAGTLSIHRRPTGPEAA